MRENDSYLPEQEANPRALTSLLLLIVSYGLVLAAPAAFSVLQGGTAQLVRSGEVPRWAPVAAAGGLALLGGAAMIAVLARLLKGIERNPYAPVMAALGVLAGVVLIALRAPVELGAVDAGSLTVLSLLVSMAGGALAQRAGPLPAVVGCLLALAPAPLIVTALWADAGYAPSLPGLLNALPPSARTYLGLLLGCGVLAALVALLSRPVRARQRARYVSPEGERREAAGPVAVAQPGAFRSSRAPAQELAFAPTLQSPLFAGSINPYGQSAYESAEPRTPERFSVWSYHDAPPSPSDFEFPVPRSKWRSPLIVLALVLLAAGLVGFFVLHQG